MLEFFRGKLIYKIVALILAVLTYLYVRVEISGRNLGIREREVLDDLNSKVIPVKVELEGTPPEGYRVLTQNIRVRPEKIIIMGKKEDLKNISEVSTIAIDVKKFKHTELISIPLVPVENAINVSSKVVEVEIPIVVIK